MVFLQFVNEFIVALVGVAGAADIYTQVSYTGNQLGIGYHTDRGCIQNHIVKFAFKISMAWSRVFRATSSVGLGGTVPPGRMYKLCDIVEG